MSTHKELKKIIERVKETQNSLVNLQAAKPIKAKQIANVNKKPAPRSGPYRQDSAAPGFGFFKWPLANPR